MTEKEVITEEPKEPVVTARWRSLALPVGRSTPLVTLGLGLIGILLAIGLIIICTNPHPSWTPTAIPPMPSKGSRDWDIRTGQRPLLDCLA